MIRDTAAPIPQEKRHVIDEDQRTTPTAAGLILSGLVASLSRPGASYGGGFVDLYRQVGVEGCRRIRRITPAEPSYVTSDRPQQRPRQPAMQNGRCRKADAARN